jgi:hypothetical protein
MSEPRYIPFNPAPVQRSTTFLAIEWLRKLGHTVEEQDVPGLYRIDNGPEITRGQLIGISIALTEGI